MIFMNIYIQNNDHSNLPHTRYHHSLRKNIFLAILEFAYFFNEKKKTYFSYWYEVSIAIILSRQ